MQVISIHEGEYFRQMTTLKRAAVVINTAITIPEITGKMQPLENYLDTYQNITSLIQSFKELMISDTEIMKTAAINMMNAESQLLK